MNFVREYLAYYQLSLQLQYSSFDMCSLSYLHKGTWHAYPFLTGGVEIWKALKNDATNDEALRRFLADDAKKSC